MKLKYVLFSGLLLSVGFTACTNEDFTEVAAPVNTAEGIALGEVTIKVGNGADTRAEFGENLRPNWEEGDLLGAARIHEIDEYDATKGVTASSPVGQASTYGGFYSNSAMQLTAGAGTNNGTFTSVDPAGLTAGAHVLYYPHNNAITQAQRESLPVEIKSYDIDCAEPLKNISDNMFAYSPVKFVPDVNSTNEFTLNQVPVLYELYFTPDFHYTQMLAEPITIKHIVIEAWKGNLPSITTVMTEKGEIKTKNAPTNKDYNDNTLSETVEYLADATGAVDHLFYNVANSDNRDYQLVTNEVRTVKPFVFSALPWSAEADRVIIKVVTSAGTFAHTYEAGDKNEAGTEYLDVLNDEATAEGGQVRLNVILDTTEEDEVIYTAEQMEDRLANIEAGETYHWILGEPITVDADLVIDKAADITISRYPLTLKSINMTNGSLTIANDLIVTGDVEIGSNVAACATQNIVPGINGQLTVGGKLTIGGGRTSEIALTLAKAGDIQIDKSGIATLTGIVAVPAQNIEATTVGNINNEGQLTLKTITITKEKTLTITKDGTLNVGDATVWNNGTVVNDGTFNMNNFDFTNKGQFDINSTLYGTNKNFANEAGAELNINCNLTTGTTGSSVKFTNAAKTSNAEAAVINVAEGSTLSINQNYTVDNKGIINVYGKIVEGNTALKQTDADAVIYVFDNATLHLQPYATCGVTGGNIMPTKDATVTGNIYAPISATVTASTDLTKLNSAVNTYIMSGNFTFKSSDPNKTDKYAAKKLVFEGGTITLEDGYTFTASKVVWFNGNTTLKNDAKDLATATGAKFTLTNWAANRINAGTLTIGNEVTLDLATNSAQLHVTNGASIKKTEASTTDPAIGAGQITGDTNIDFEL